MSTICPYIRRRHEDYVLWHSEIFDRFGAQV